MAKERTIKIVKVDKDKPVGFDQVTAKGKTIKYRGKQIKVTL
jgi:hypothetical protein